MRHGWEGATLDVQQHRRKAGKQGTIIASAGNGRAYVFRTGGELHSMLSLDLSLQVVSTGTRMPLNSVYK